MDFLTKFHIIGTLTPVILLWILLYAGVATFSGANAWNRLGDVLWCRLEGIRNGVRVQTNGDFLVEFLTMIIALAFMTLGILSTIAPGQYLIFVLLAGAGLKLVRSGISRRTREVVLGDLQVESTTTLLRKYYRAATSGTFPKDRTSAEAEQHIVEQMNDMEKEVHP